VANADDSTVMNVAKETVVIMQTVFSAVHELRPLKQ